MSIQRSAMAVCLLKNRWSHFLDWNGLPNIIRKFHDAKLKDAEAIFGDCSGALNREISKSHAPLSEGRQSTAVADCARSIPAIYRPRALDLVTPCVLMVTRLPTGLRWS
jgi:hypothetical protein